MLLVTTILRFLLVFSVTIGGIAITEGLLDISDEFSRFNDNFDFTVEEESAEDDIDLSPNEDAMVREIALMQVPASTVHGQGEIVDGEGAHEHAVLLKKLQKVQSEINRLNDRLDQQAYYIKALRMRLKEIAAKLEKATDDVPQTNEDYARIFSIIRHEHGMLQANLYTYIFNANRGKVDPPSIRPRNYDFELPEQEPTPFPPPVVN